MATLIAPHVKCLAPCKIVHKSYIFRVFLKAYQINQVTEEKVFDFLCVIVCKLCERRFPAVKPRLHYAKSSSLLAWLTCLKSANCLHQECPTRGPRKGFEWPAGLFRNYQYYQLNCFVIYGELTFREIVT